MAGSRRPTPTCARTVALDELVDVLELPTTRIKVSGDVEPYWKRWFEYSCTNRLIAYHEISYVLKGRIHGEIEGDHLDLAAGDMFWMAPRARHSMTWCEQLIYYTFRFSVHDRCEEVSLNRPFVHSSSAGSLEPLFSNLASLLKNDPANPYHEKRIKAYLLLIAAHIAMPAGSPPADTGNRELTDAERSALFEYCSRSGFAEVDSSVLADYLGLSRDYFSRVFKQTFGKSTRSWLFEQKMHFAARQLVDTDLPIEEIAGHAGYLDVYLFARQFKRVLGLTPKRYRQRNRWGIHDDT